jgi:superfamily II DNA/RNA helicase
MNEFKRRREKGGERERGVILISTDLSSRGLDVKDIDIVVNLENSSKFETHIHRIGRTGRAGKKGQAYTLILANEHLFLSQLINSFHSNSLPLPSSLLPFNNQS